MVTSVCQEDRITERVVFAMPEDENIFTKKIFLSVSEWWIVLSGLLLASNICCFLTRKRRRIRIADGSKPERAEAGVGKIDRVTVLFADIEGFYDIVDKMPATALINGLNDFFVFFDTVVDRYHLEKIKTIGDAYMCAGGLRGTQGGHPACMVLAALEVQHHLYRLRNRNPDGWSVRIGIHTGEAYAGMLGQKKLTYDIWGHTVNLASRLESLCPPDKINISDATYEHVKQFFICEYHGPLPVRLGNGCAYYVKGLKPEYAERSSSGQPLPNRRFFEELAVPQENRNEEDTGK
ncbi:MAG: adenylate/guanylate cyclase domain-containing protein [Bacteroidales bacterium]|nr:adenylate/guanylate cyclase domain-containing protein [Bacteroidales bacterium]